MGYSSEASSFSKMYVGASSQKMAPCSVLCGTKTRRLSAIALQPFSTWLMPPTTTRPHKQMLAAWTGDLSLSLPLLRECTVGTNLPAAKGSSSTRPSHRKPPWLSHCNPTAAASYAMPEACRLVYAYGMRHYPLQGAEHAKRPAHYVAARYAANSHPV